MISKEKLKMNFKIFKMGCTALSKKPTKPSDLENQAPDCQTRITSDTIKKFTDSLLDCICWIFFFTIFSSFRKGSVNYDLDLPILCLQPVHQEEFGSSITRKMRYTTQLTNRFFLKIPAQSSKDETLEDKHTDYYFVY